MLLKIDSATDDVSNARPQVGNTFYRYIFSDVYDKGEIIEVEAKSFTVDFGDTIQKFETADCTAVFSASHLDHLMTCAEGQIIRDFRKRGTTATYEVFDDLDLDVGDWFV